MQENIQDYSKMTIKDLDSKILFVTGGPGCGKGTQCAKMVNFFGFKHLSVGDLMRAEKIAGTDLWHQIAQYADKGELVPTEIVIEVISKALQSLGKNRYIIDGFPRELEQALIFEQNVGEIQSIMQFETPEDVIISRLLGRMEATPVAERRADDNPETMKKRVHTYFEVSKIATDFYHRLGKVTEVDAIGDVNQVYARVKQSLKPNIICVTGAVAMGKTTFARHLASFTHYVYIDVITFFATNNAISNEEKVKVLVDFLYAAPKRNFVLDNFPENEDQAQIFWDNFIQPIAAFHFRSEKDEVYNRIDVISKGDTAQIKSLRTKYDGYLKLKDGLEGFYLKKERCYTIQQETCPKVMFRKALDHINPQLLVSVNSENQELSERILSHMRDKQGYIIIDFEKIIEDEKSRGLDLGMLLLDDPSPENFLCLFRKIIYSEPFQNKKYILSNIPNSYSLLKSLENDICTFDKLIYFTNQEGGVPSQQSKNFSRDWTDIIGHYHSRSMLVEVGVDDPDIINFHIEKRNRYGLVVGPVGTGKTRISKMLKKEKIAKLYILEKYKEELVKRLSTDDNPIDEVSNDQVFHNLDLDLKKAPLDQITILDTFPFNDGGFANIIERLGKPLFILRLTADEELVTQRYKKKHDTEELSDEDKEIIAQSLALNEDINSTINEIMETSSSLTVYDIDASAPEITTLETVKSIFQKRIFITRNINPDFNEDLLRNRLGFLCARYGYQFIAMEDVLKAREIQNASCTDPHSIIDMVKSVANSSKQFVRNIFLYNYLKADGTEGISHDFYPNSKDEIFFIQQSVGSIRCCFDFVKEMQNTIVNREIEEKVVIAAPVKKKKDDDDDASNNDEEEEEGKKKFNPDDYSWYKTDSTPMTFPQFFNQMKPTTQINIQYTAEMFTYLEEKYMTVHESMEEGKDSYFYIQCVPFEPANSIQEIASPDQ